MLGARPVAGESEPSASSAKSASASRAPHVVACLMPHLLFASLAVGLLMGHYWLLLPPVFILVLLPLLDLLTGWQDDGQFDKAEFSSFEVAVLSWNVRLYSLLYMAMVGALTLHIARFDRLETGLLVASSALLGAIGFAAAHELLHGKDRIDQVLQKVLTIVLFYPHYKLIHIRSHHVHAATSTDENTAWEGEGIYSYIVRTIPGSFVRCWQMEAHRIAQRCSGPPAFLRNEMLANVLAQLGLLGAIYAFTGVGGLLFYAAQVAGAHFVLECVNYVQHYGLRREEAQAGGIERTGPRHSWDSYHYFSSYLTFRVGHHSNHHLRVTPYYLLATEPSAPKLPVGYFWAIAMVLLPRWWRAVIDPKIPAPRSATRA